MRSRFQQSWWSSLLLLGLAFNAGAASPTLKPGEQVYRSSAGAIDGHDPVAYFTTGKPQAGSAQFSWDWNGASWRFASAENRARFQAAPEKYAPQFGGYCAYAVGNNYTAKTDPQAWSIVDGKLYLNYNAEVSKLWQAKRAQFITDGERNWPALSAPALNSKTAP